MMKIYTYSTQKCILIHTLRMSTYFSRKGFLIKAEMTFTPLYSATPLRKPLLSRLRNATASSSVWRELSWPWDDSSTLPNVDISGPRYPV